MATVGDLAGRLNLGVVAVVGAGLSLGARYPNTSGLNALLWDAVDSDPQARAAVAARLSVTDAPAKALIAEDADRWGVAWAMVAESAVARRRFQSGFASLDQARAGHPSPSHEALARLIHVGTVEAVVSFNWDSALESAYARLYGTSIPEGVLFKPHGDVARPDLPWTLPHQDGRISFDVLRRVTALVEEHPRTLLIVGYSESDRDVIEQLIAPLDERWWVSRVGPSADGPDDVAGTADEVLGALAEAAARDEDAAAWHVVTFDNQRGIEAALEGRRLLPRDVAACPPLPEVHLVAESLRRNHAVVLNGESGSGKSIRLIGLPVGVAARRWAGCGADGVEVPEDRRRPSSRLSRGPRRCPTLRRAPVRLPLIRVPAATCCSAWTVSTSSTSSAGRPP